MRNRTQCDGAQGWPLAGRQRRGWGSLNGPALEIHDLFKVNVDNASQVRLTPVLVLIDIG
jgi:hypothetical protein